MTPSNAGRSQIIEFWRACELFSPQTIPKVDPRDAVAPVFSVTPGEPLPWEEGHPLKRRRLNPDRTWRHLLFGGVFELTRVRTLLEQVFGADPESHDSRPPGTSALFALVVTDDGRPLFGSAEFSSGAWAAGRTADPGPKSPKWLTGFEEASVGLAAAFQRVTAAHQGDGVAAELARKGIHVGRPLGQDELAGLVQIAAERLGVTRILAPAGLLVKSVQVGRTRAYNTEEGSEFLNSFIVPDLTRVAAAVRSGGYGPALAEYLSTREPARVDLRADNQAIYRQVIPDLVPLGRWPAAADRPLALSQQFAVNTIMSRLASSAGLFAVNGPPGTGKTTMLRDLVAANVVERAIRLAALPSPAAAFTGKHTWATGEYVRVIHTWRADLTGFEMVVASANNGAVANVTTEIPGRHALDPPWRDGADYFAELATRVLDAPAWGLVAARLGRKSFRTEFVSRMWWGTKEKPGLRETLKEWNHDQAGAWRPAVKAFQAAHERVRALRRSRQDVCAMLGELDDLPARVDQLAAEIAAGETRFTKLRAELAEREGHAESVRREVQARERARLAHRELQPTLVTAIFTLGKASRQWLAEDQVLVAALQDAQGRLGAARAREDELRSGVARVTDELVTRRGSLASARERIAELRAKVEPHRANLGEFLPTEAWWAGEERRELRTLWTDPQWNAARSDLFLHALRLHQAFLRAHPTVMRNNLQAAMDVLTGEAPRDAPPEAVLAAWQSLFFLVPVVSTTFASFDRMFSHLGRESLGWLLIDEAGQAAPQLAAGAIWRSRRVVAVGDPLQLEPIVTLPFTAQQALRGTFGVAGEKWLPARTSVQQLADAVTGYGTYLPGESGPIWVGAPLRVHRRCDQPMFTISNAIAYDGLMVYGKSAGAPLALPESMWLDVVATESEGHWIPAEGVVLERILTRLTREGVAPADIFVISPFRTVVRSLSKVTRAYRGIEAGTVHTAQGKEADVVILVLGGDPRSPGAKQWAARNPNLLNVAVSRAKRRLYLIGNRDEWAKQRYFTTVAQELRHTTL
ncbi:DNA helicase [Acrocarpospora corrugata]|uniref:DNA helicase n=1 Tax=Acrocarpospora corrugata TaxID=35763 RepID=A0A5M3VQR2_9ACTN|nr:DEAD/DEAH box helicase [Acrocarpospora corrugata]GER98538.1 DNA helicase [Acrocarpospora corrugata]